MKQRAIVSWSVRLMVKMRYRFKRCVYYVCSEEPFSEELIWRGPFNRKDAMTLIAVNSACGSIDRLYEDIDGILVAQ